MKIVIDIPRKTYEHIRADGGHGYFNIYDEDNRIVTKAVFNGEQLPEHHGRLIDADALEEYFRNVRKELKASDYKNGIEFFVRDEMLLNVQQFIHLCDAIIEGSDSE